jgi:hypothetical protein
MNCSYYTSPDDLPDYDDYDEYDEETEIVDDIDDEELPDDDYSGHYDDGVLL